MGIHYPDRSSSSFSPRSKQKQSNASTQFPSSAAAARYLRRKLVRTKRRVIIALWSIAFAYISLTSVNAQSDSTDIYSSDSTDSRAGASSSSFSPDLTSSSLPAPSGGSESDTRGPENPSSVTNGILSASSTPSSFSGQEAVVSSSSPPSIPPGSANISVTTQIPDVLIPGLNCTPAAIDDFPRDLFTPEQRKQGYLAVHFIASVYIFYCLASVCDDYFVPSIECICDELRIPSDVAGATFMAIATSSPELFTNIVGTFITKGDIGVGTIVGSAVFNILGVCACCGIAAKTALPLEWYPLTRDCLFYSISVILLIVFLGNRQVFWYEALVLVLCYFVYIFVMYKNSAIRSWAENLQQRISFSLGFSKDLDEEGDSKRKRTRSGRRASFVAELTASTERTPLLGAGRDLENEPPEKNWLGESIGITDKSGDIPAEVLDEMLIASALHKSQAQAEVEEAEWSLIRIPFNEGFFTVIQWVLTWPARFVFAFTVPDCREEKLRKLYPITFFMCIVWIAVLSYLVSWTMTVIGHTLSIPDSVMGLTFIAAGTSIPEAVSSIIVARQGLGTMSISNSIGSNTFDILVCLGLPWLIRGSIISSEPVNYIQINSGGLEYSTITLLVSLFLLYVILACNGFYLDKKVGVAALLLYSCFLVFASLFEMNVFFTVNLPTCPSDF